MRTLPLTTSLLFVSALSAQTALVRDLNPGAPHGCGPAIAMMGGKGYFAGSDGTWKNELWTTDGTFAGTARVSALAPAGDAEVIRIVGLTDRVVFRARTPSTGSELFVSDGTSAGTTLLYDLASGSADGAPDDMTVVGDKVWFTSLGSLWLTDGTASGTRKVADIPSGSVGFPAGFAGIGAKVVFRATTTALGAELWESDGTVAGTKLLKDLYPGGTALPFEGNPQFMTALAGKVYFSAASAGTGRQLWVTDGTSLGTVPVTTGPSNLDPRNLLAFAGKVWFSGGPSPDLELWESDGTAVGTLRTLDIWPGTTGSSPYALTAFAGYLWFAATTPTRGTELFRSDGTAAGTVLLGTRDAPNDSVPNAIAGNGRTQFAAGTDMMFFRALDSVRGYELWVARKDTRIRPVAIGCGAPLSGPHRVPTLRANDPFVGGTMTVDIDEAYPGSRAYLLVGSSAVAPIAFPRSGCDLWLDAGLLVVANTWAVATATTGATLAVPANPALAGGRFSLQAIFTGTNAPFGIDLSNALRATVRS